MNIILYGKKRIFFFFAVLKVNNCIELQLIINYKIDIIIFLNLLFLLLVKLTLIFEIFILGISSFFLFIHYF